MEEQSRLEIEEDLPDDSGQQHSNIAARAKGIDQSSIVNNPLVKDRHDFERSRACPDNGFSVSPLVKLANACKMGAHCCGLLVQEERGDVGS